jgi:hypothetical protein
MKRNRVRRVCPWADRIVAGDVRARFVIDVASLRE